MTVTDQLNIIDNKIKANQAQYDSDRLVAKISAYSSSNLRKYEHLAGEDLRCKPSIFEQANFDYSPLGNVFTKRLDKDYQKKGLSKRLKNIEDKNEELLSAFSVANKVSKAAKTESDYNYDNTFAFYEFYRGFKKFKRMSLGCKYGEINDFYMLLNAFINIHQVTKNRKKNYAKSCATFQ